MYHLLNPHLFFSGRCTILILLNKSLLLGRCTICQTPIFFLCIFICGRCTVHQTPIIFISIFLYSQMYHLLNPHLFFSGRCTILILLNKSLLLGSCTICQTPIFFLCIFICGRCTVRQTPIIFISIFLYSPMYHLLNPHLFF